MAGDWIKMRSDLFTHPKVVRMSSALKADTLKTVGGLMSVWCLFDAHSEDGRLEGYTSETLDTHLRWPGFSDQMKVVGWLDEDAQGLTLPRFDAHNGQSSKRRAQDADRKREVRKMSDSDEDKMRTREEKRREEKNINTKTIKPAFDPLTLSLPIKLDPDAWKEWIEYRKQRRLSNTERTISAQLSRLAEWQANGHDPTKIIADSIANGWQGLFEPKSNVTRTVHDERKEWLDKALGKREERDITAHATRLD